MKDLLALIGGLTVLGVAFAVVAIAFGARRARQMMRPYADEHQGML